MEKPLFERNKSYAYFSELICNKEIYKNHDLTFEEICQEIPYKDVSELNEILKEELGLSGNEILRELRKKTF